MEKVNVSNELLALYDVATFPMRPMSQEQAVDLLLDKTAALFGDSLVAFYLYSDQTAAFLPLKASRVDLTHVSEVSLEHAMPLLEAAGEHPFVWRRDGDVDLPAVLGLQTTIQAALLAPLQLDDAPLGLLCIARDGDADVDFTASEQLLFEALAKRSVDALVTARSFSLVQEEHKHELQHARALHDLFGISLELAKHRKFEPLVKAVVDQASSLLHADGCALWIWRETEQVLRFAYASGKLHSVALQLLHSGEGVVGNAFVEGKTQVFSGTQGDAIEDFDASGLTVLAVPLLFEDTVLGVLLVERSCKESSFSESEAHLAELLSRHAASLIQNVVLIEESSSSLSEAEVLYHASAELGSAATYDSVLSVLRTYTVIGDADLNVSVNLFDQPWVQDEMPEWSIPVARWSKLSTSATMQRYPLRKFSAASTLLKRDVPTLVTDVANDARLDENTRHLYQKVYGAGSTIFVPLVVGQQWIGYINAIYSQPRQFLEGGVRQLMNLVGQAAVMVQSIQRLEMVGKRALQLETASEVSRAASSILNLEELLPEVAMLIRERFDLYYVGIFLLDDTKHWALLRAGTGAAGQKMLERGHRLEAGGDSMIGMCVAQCEARIALDVGAEAVHFDNPDLPDTRSELALPLISRGQPIGAMTIQSSESAAFSKEDITVLQTMADQVANVISNARFFAEAQERLETLQDLQRQTTAESWAAYTREQEVLGFNYDLNEVTPLEATLEVPVTADVAKGEIVAKSDADQARLLAPITLHGAPIGLLGFEETERSRIWSEGDLALVAAVREQLSLALENRLLFAQTRDALAETSSLYEISQHISEAQTTEEIFASTVAGLSLRPEIDYLVAGIFTPFGEPEQMDILHAWSRDDGSLDLGAISNLDELGGLYEALVANEQFVSADVAVEQALNFADTELCKRCGLHGVAAFLLQVRDVPQGMIFIGLQEPHDFSAEELRFYETVTHTTSVALENQHLLEATQKEAQRRAFLNEVMSTASAVLDPDELMHGVGELISARLARPTMVWRLAGEQHVYPIAIHLADGTDFEFDRSLSLKLSDLSGIGAAARLRRPILWRFENRPYRSEGFKDLIDALALEEVFSVPLVVRDEVLGIIVLGRCIGEPEVDEDTKGSLRSAAVNIGVSLENARLYRDAQETAEKLKEVDRLKSEFLANMSHELRTPLNSIIGFSRVILKGIDGPLTDLQQTDLLAIYESGKHLLNLINDILDLSKIEAGKMEFNFEPTDVKDIVRGVLSTAVALVKDKPIELEKVVPDSLPTILSDERRIRQVILNLVGNASKFTEKGFIRISASYDDHDVVIAVQDTGIGIPPEKYSAVFQEFQQVDSSSTRSYGGTGLGLPVSKKFVEAHGGRIWFESEVGVGSIFYVALPIEGPQPESPEGESAESLEEVRTVLAVDDDPNVIKLFHRYLEKQGYQVVGLTKPSEVVSEAQRIKPYAITLDILMPDLDGWQVIRELKSNPETRDIPVIVCSILRDTDKGLSMGVSDYLIKPVSEHDLLFALERLAEDAGPNQVLVVDDHPDDRKLLRRLLEGAGYFVAEASGGADAIVKIHEEPPDLIILDLMMPEVDGFAVLENLKENEETRSIPVVVVTAKELSSEERERLYMRAEALLQKGIFNQEQLLEDIRVALERLAPHD